MADVEKTEHQEDSRWEDHSALDLSIQLSELPQLILRRRRWLIASVVGSFFLGIAYLTVAAPVYNVSARLLVQPRDVPLREEDSMIRGGTFLTTQAEIINSAAVIRSALESVPAPDFDGTAQERLEEVLESFGVTPVGKTNVLTLSHWSANPEEAVRIVDATIESYRQFVRETGHGELEALQILTRKEKELREALTVAEDAYQAYRSQSQLVGSNDQVFNAPKAMLSRLGDQLVEARARRVELQARLRSATARQAKAEESHSNRNTPADADVAAGASPRDAGSGFAADVEKIEQELWQAKMHVAGLLQNYGEAHPQVREARQRVGMWEGRLVESLGAERSELERETRAASSVERQVNALYAGELEKTKALDSQQLDERRLLEKVQRVQAAHQSMVNKLSEWELTLEAVTQLQGRIAIRVLEEPGLRVAKVWPKPVLVLGACGFVGLVGGLLLALIADRAPTESD